MNALLQQITQLLLSIDPFPKQYRSNYSSQMVEGFILGWKRTYDLETQHLEPSQANEQFPELLRLASLAMNTYDPNFEFASIQVNRRRREIFVFCWWSDRSYACASTRPIA